jgi:hypothetical protein
MKKILFVLICLAFIPTQAFGAMEYVEGSTTGVYYDKESDLWITRIIRVYALSDVSVIDDLTYITVGEADKITKGFLLEKGLPGEPNKDTRRERKRFINLLEDSLILVEESKRSDNKDLPKRLGRFYSFNIMLGPAEKGGDVRLGIVIHDYEKKKVLTVYMNQPEVEGLIALLEKVPPLLEELRTKEQRYPVLP